MPSSSLIKMQAAGSFELFATVCQATLLHISRTGVNIHLARTSNIIKRKII
jgi:hypothetical protein